MSQAQELAHRLEEVFLNGKWIANTNYKEQLENTSFEAALKSLPDCNSVAKLSYHINYYLEGLIRVLDGGPLDMSDKYSFDLPEIASEQAWQALKDRLLRNAQTFTDKVAALPETMLDAPFVTPQYGTYRKNIEAVVEHSYYHLGQIVLIRKLIATH